MKQAEYLQWWVWDPIKGARRKTRYRMTREQALAEDTGATPVDGSLEVRWVPESVDEHQHTSSWRRDAPG